MTRAARARYAGYRFPAEIISHAVWLYFRLPLGLRMVEELLVARGIIVARNGAAVGAQIWPAVRQPNPSSASAHRRQMAFRRGRAQIAGVKHWLWRAVDQTGIALDVLVQRRRDKQAAKRLLRKLLKKQMRPPRVMITDKLTSYGAAKQHRASPAQGNEQPSGKLAPADAPTRAANEAIQIGRSGAALPLSPRPDQ
jgi:putative transposase